MCSCANDKTLAHKRISKVPSWSHQACRCLFLRLPKGADPAQRASSNEVGLNHFPTDSRAANLPGARHRLQEYPSQFSDVYVVSTADDVVKPRACQSLSLGPTGRQALRRPFKAVDNEQEGTTRPSLCLCLSLPFTRRPFTPRLLSRPMSLSSSNPFNNHIPSRDYTASRRRYSSKYAPPSLQHLCSCFLGQGKKS